MPCSLSARRKQRASGWSSAILALFAVVSVEIFRHAVTAAGVRAVPAHEQRPRRGGVRALSFAGFMGAFAALGVLRESLSTVCHAELSRSWRRRRCACWRRFSGGRDPRGRPARTRVHLLSAARTALTLVLTSSPARRVRARRWARRQPATSLDRPRALPLLVCIGHPVMAADLGLSLRRSGPALAVPDESASITAGRARSAPGRSLRPTTTAWTGVLLGPSRRCAFSRDPRLCRATCGRHAFAGYLAVRLPTGSATRAGLLARTDSQACLTTFQLPMVLVPAAN